MDIQEFVKKFAEECGKKLNIEAIYQIGSSTYSTKFNDVDLVIFFNDNTMSTKNIRGLGILMRKYESKSNEVAFITRGDIASIIRSSQKIVKKPKYLVSVTPQISLSANLIKRMDLYTPKIISMEKNKRLLAGRNIFKNVKIDYKKDGLYTGFLRRRYTLIDLLHYPVQAKEIYKKYLKVMLRLMVAYKTGSFVEKDEILPKFSSLFPELNEFLPKNTNELLRSKKIIENDFYDILYFNEKCLEWLYEKEKV